MKQVTQRLRNGVVEVLDVPWPELGPGGVLVDVRASLISAGTERSKIESGRQSLLGKARSRPDQVRQVLEKVRRDGVQETVQAVRTRLDQPSPLGYSSGGVALAVGDGVRDVLPGAQVACGGAGANHAEIAHVPANLCVPAPAGLSHEEAAFATVGSIALHAVRQAEARVGERVAVIGLGLVGQLAARILRAAGCTVVGVDLSEGLLERARAAGAVDVALPRDAVAAELPADARDCDAVVITAATRSSDPVELAARLCRDRGRVVVVGDVGLELPRTAYYNKELELRLSRSYGPGRYDVEYEERGLDYPIGYVRWTERRNMRAFLDLVASRRVSVSDLITTRVAVDRAPEAYAELLQSGSPLAVVLEYPAATAARPPRAASPPTRAPRGSATAAVVGAGSFAQRVLIPGLRGAGFDLRGVASATGLSARAAADRFPFAFAGSVAEVVSDPSAELVAIATRHASHADLAIAALEAGKHVFVEKPPAVTREDLARLRAARGASGRLVAVGFNRRHAPLAARLKAFVREPRTPVQLLYRVNAGRLPAEHWLNDLADGGGRLVGEGCHFVDFACWLVDALPERVTCTMSPDPGAPLAAAQSFAVVLGFADGSNASIHYIADGAPSVAKELVEAHAGGRSAILDDFRSLRLHGTGRPQRVSGGDRGHAAQFVALRRQLAEPAAELDPLDTTGVVFAALDAAEAAALGPEETSTAG